MFYIAVHVASSCTGVPQHFIKRRQASTQFLQCFRVASYLMHAPFPSQARLQSASCILHTCRPHSQGATNIHCWSTRADQMVTVWLYWATIYLRTAAQRRVCARESLHSTSKAGTPCCSATTVSFNTAATRLHATASDLHLFCRHQASCGAVCRDCCCCCCVEAAAAPSCWAPGTSPTGELWTDRWQKQPCWGHG